MLLGARCVASVDEIGRNDYEIGPINWYMGAHTDDTGGSFVARGGITLGVLILNLFLDVREKLEVQNILTATQGWLNYILVVMVMVAKGFSLTI